MALEGINTAMTTLQFARLRSASRAIESNESLSKKPSAGRNTALALRLPHAQPAPIAPHRLVPPPSLRCIYQLSNTNGRPAAKRVLQRADMEQWAWRISRLA
jgi:hypothetical protein